MILYQLRCGKDHEFEAWFKDGATCDRQLSRKTVECPVCGNKKVAKALMAPRIGASEKAQPAVMPANPQQGSQQQGMSVMAEGGMVADVVVVVASIDPVLGGVDR